MRLLRVLSLLPALLLLAAPLEAEARERVMVQKALSLKEVGSGQSQFYPGRAGYGYEVVRTQGEITIVQMFDPTGNALGGLYELPTAELPDALKDSVKGALRATATGAQAKVPGCCDVVEDAPDEPKKISRAPAIVPGSLVVVEPSELVKPKRMPATKAAPAPAPARRAPAEVTACEMFANFRQKGVPEAALRQALYFLNETRSGRRAGGSRYLAIADYSQNSRNERFYLLDLKTGNVNREKVSHGGGSRRGGYRGDPNHDGNLDRCGGPNSNMTRAGFFSTGGYYRSPGNAHNWPRLAGTKRSFYNGVRLRGLTPKVNTDAFDQGYVMHEARYNFGGRMPMGRSHGCPAFVPGKGAPILRKMVEDSTVLYNYAPVCREQMSKVYDQVAGWQNFCK